jgi:N-acetylmuramoyl-L-alanine amidase
MIDPGHGGPDSGAHANGLYEYKVNWAFAQKVTAELKKHGYKVILSHNSTSSACLTSHYSQHAELQCRLNKAYQNHADLYLSIHANAMPSSSKYYVNGVEVHYNAAKNSEYPQENAFPTKSKRLATLLDQAVVPAMKEKNLGLINDHLYVTRMARIPSVLIEMGYLTNKSDASKLKDPASQQRSAVAIGNAMDQYFKEGN